MKRQAQLLTCAFLSSVFFTCMLVKIFYMLNPEAGWSAWRIIRLGLSIYWPYGLAPLLLTFFGFHLAQFLMGRPLQVWWFSIPTLAWAFAADGLVALLLVARNTMLYQAFISVARTRAMVASIVSWIAFVVVMVLIGSYHHFFPKMRWRKAGITLGAAAVLALAIPGRSGLDQQSVVASDAQVPPSGLSSPSKGNVVMVGIEGGSLNYLLPLISQGRLPHFETLLKSGAGGRLQTLTPAQSRPLWATLFTGLPPAASGVTGENQYELVQPGLVLYLLPRGLFFQSVLERTGALRVSHLDPIRRNTICYWDFFRSSHGMSATVIDLWAPVSGLHGYLAENVSSRGHDRVFPPEIAPTVAAIAREAQAEAESRASAMLGGRRIESADEWKRGVLVRALQGDECARRLAARFESDVVAFRIRGLDAVGHYLPPTFAGDSYSSLDQPDEPFERVIELYYRYYDEIIGECMDSLPDDSLLCVVSVHGMEPLPVWRRMFELLWDQPAPVAGHESGPDGFLYFYGKDIAPGISLPHATLYNVLPTLLYYHGLTIGLDMRGRILLEVFTRSFKETRPASYVPTHEIH